MKNSRIRLALVLVAVLMTTTLFNCKDDEEPKDPNEEVVVSRDIIVSALNAFTSDSISQFDLKITSPSGTVTKTSTGNTYKITDLVAGEYKIVVSKSGFTTSEEQAITVVLPTDPKVSLHIPAGVLLTKTAAPVVVTGATGGTIAVKEDASNTSSAPVAKAEVQPGTTFTLADGSKPASVSISVTNIPVNSDVAPVETVGGVEAVAMPSGSNVEVIDNKIPSTKLNLQPEGLVLSQPMIISVDLSGRYEDMTMEEIIESQSGLAMTYERKDGTFETVKPDSFSPDRMTVYYKISHFSQWTEVDENVTFEEEKATGLSPEQIAESLCGEDLVKTFNFNTVTDKKAGRLLTGKSKPVKFNVQNPIKITKKPGYYGRAKWSAVTKSYILSQKVGANTTTYRVLIPQNGVWTYEYIVCHNQ